MVLLRRIEIIQVLIEGIAYFYFSPGRNDIFYLRSFSNYHKPVEIVLNENKLANVYK